MVVSLPLQEFGLLLVYSILVLLINIMSYGYLLLKLYRVICYTRLTLEWFPMINPYVWPFVVLETMTAFYFRAFEKLVPPIRFERSIFDISVFLSLESINALLTMFMHFIHYIFELLQATENIRELLQNQR